MTPFGKQLFLAQTAREIYGLLGIAPDCFHDEGQNIWVTTGKPLISPEQPKFGTKSLALNASSALQTAAPLTFGGDPFTISFWVKATTMGTTGATHYFFRALGTSNSFGITISGNSPPGVRFCTGTTSLSTEQFNIINKTKICTSTTGTWQNYEIGYNGSSNVKVFFNGTLYWNVSLTVDREPRRLMLGGFDGYLDSFRILDGVCAHSAAFSVPTDAYKLSQYPNNTLSLMNFE